MGPKRVSFPPWDSLGLSNLFLRNDDISVLPPLPTLPTNYVMRATDLPESEHSGLANCLAEAFMIQHGEWTAPRVIKEFVAEEKVKQTFIIEYINPETQVSEIVGTASAKIEEAKYTNETGYLHWVGVHPDHQGHGFGLILSLQVLYYFRDNLGCKSAVLETQDTSLPAIRTYFKLGFHEVHTDDSHGPRWEVVHTNLKNAVKN